MGARLEPLLRTLVAALTHDAAATRVAALELMQAALLL